MRLDLKHLLIVFILMGSVLFMAACGGDDEPTVTPEPPPTATTAPATATPQPTVAPAAQPASPLQSESPLSAPASSDVQSADGAPAAGAAVLTGKIQSNAYTPARFMDHTSVRLAVVIWNEDHTDGNFVLDGGGSPGDYTDPDGTFTFQNLAPNDYVMVVGDIIGYHEVIMSDDGKPKIFTVAPGSNTDVGVIEVSLQ